MASFLFLDMDGDQDGLHNLQSHYKMKKMQSGVPCFKDY